VAGEVTTLQQLAEMMGVTLATTSAIMKILQREVGGHGEGRGYPRADLQDQETG
jgi:hypothetical protein